MLGERTPKELPVASAPTVNSCTWHHAIVFCVTYVTMSLLHGCRKSFSDVKFTMAESLSPASGAVFPHRLWKSETMFSDALSANVFFGELDLFFLLAFAVGLYLSGAVGDRVNLMYFFAVGVLLSAITLFLFGYISAILNIRNKAYYLIVYFMTGLFQSTGMPTSVAIMGNWFSTSSVGLVFGIWSTHLNVGNICGTIVIAEVLDYGYEYGMLLNSISLFYSGVVVMLCLIPRPELISVGLPTGDECAACEPDGEDEKLKGTEDVSPHDTLLPPTNDQPSADNISELGQRKAINVLEALVIPDVLAYAISLFFLNMVTYGLFFWLPMYLSQNLLVDVKRSVWLSNLFDIGFIVGSVMCGGVIDLVGVRSPVLVVMLLLSTGFIYMFNYMCATGFMATGVILILTGMFIGGPTNIIHTSVCADLGKHQSVIDANAEATSTVTGIIDGTGTLGGAIGQFCIGVISEYGGWHWVFIFLVAMLVFSILCLLPLVVKEIRYFRSNMAQYKSYDELPMDDDL